MKNMSAMINIAIQNVSNSSLIPTEQTLRDWALSALEQRCDTGELTLRLVDTAESQTLNQQYRQQNKPTNVLAFPFTAFAGLDISTPIIGDLVICAPLVNQEAKQQNKAPAAHWAHIVIHGVLHLLGYDHLKAAETKRMEDLEIDLLQQLGYANPYE